MRKRFLAIAIIIFSAIWDTNAQNMTSHIDSVRTLLKTTPNDTNRVNLLNELAYSVWNDGNKYDEALKYANEAKSLAESLGFKSGLAVSLRRIGIIYNGIGDYARAFENLFKSLQINESIQNEYEVFLIHGDIGVVYYNQKNLSEALIYFLKSYQYKKDDPFTLRWIGIIYLEQKKYELSLEFLNSSLQYKQSKNEISGTLNLIGTIYEYQNKIDSAFKFYSSSLKIKQDINAIDGGLCDVLGSLGDLYFTQKVYDKSIEYELMSLEIAKQIKYLYGIRETERKLTDIYDSIGNTAKAYEHFKNFVAIQNILENDEQTKKTVRAEMNYQFDKKEAIEKAIHESEINRQTIIRNGVIGGLCLVLIFSVFIFRSYTKTKRQKKIIEIKSEETEKQKLLIEEKQKEITDNISYAKNIQRAILPSDEYLKKNIGDHFVIYRPKDIVSGDFYWSYRDDFASYICSSDSTGHGVSGAMMSMIGASLLNEIVIERKITSPEKVLNTLRDEIIKALNQQGAAEERKDGYDISFVKISGSYTTAQLECASANNPIYIVRNSQVIEIKPNRFPVGKYSINESFTLNKMELQKDDIIYTLSDGFVDQFGGERNKKLMAKQFKLWISELSHLSMEDTKAELESRFTRWLGSGEQTDDVTVFATKVNLI